jgi:endoribonuclease Dicer
VDYIEDPLTGRRIHRFNAVAVVKRLQDHLPVGHPFVDIKWRILDKKGQYFGKLVAPDPIPLRSLKGGVATTPFEAEELVCFHLCRELSILGLLDYVFFPKDENHHTTELGTSGPGAEDPEISKSSGSTRKYERKRPQFLANTISIAPTRLFPLVIEIGEFTSQLHAPMLILARAPLPPFSKFRVFSFGEIGYVSLTRAAPFDISEERLHLLHLYSLRICRAILNKPVENPLESLPFLFAPLPKEWKVDNHEAQFPWLLPAVEEHIPWKDVQIAAEKWATNFTSDNEKITEQEVDDCVIQDRAVEFTNRHFLVQLRHDLTPLSKPEDGLV